MPVRRRPPDPPPLEVRQFTAAEAERAIKLLVKRIDEVKSLDPKTVTYSDERVHAAERKIRATVLEVFGQNSVEYRDHQSHKISGRRSIRIIGYGEDPRYVEAERQQDFAEGLPRTVTMLEALIETVRERELGADTSSRVRTAFEGLDPHARIWTVSADLYRNGHYRNAVLDASVALVNLVKEKSRHHDLDGAPLMTTVFSKNKPILAFNDLTDKTDEDEQEGMMHLFVGAVLALRNTRAHALLDDSPEMALEYIALISLLAKRVDQTKRMTR